MNKRVELDEKSQEISVTICRAGIETDTENRLVDTAGEGERMG